MSFLNKTIADQNGNINTIRVGFVKEPKVYATPPLSAEEIASAYSKPSEVMESSIGKNRININLLKEKVNFSTATEVDNEQEAENIFIKTVLKEIPATIYEKSNDMIYNAASYRAANLIAQRTRRGAGNYIIHNIEDKNNFTESVFTLVENNNLPVGTYIVLYKGHIEADCPAIFVENEDKKFLYFLPNNEDAIGNWQYYVQVVSIR